MVSGTTKSYAKTSIALAVIIIVSYLSLCWAGAVPSQYDIIRQQLGTKQPVNNTTTASIHTPLTMSLVKVSGFPSKVNVSAHHTNDYTITFRCAAGEGKSIVARLSANTNASVSFGHTARWKVSDDGHTAVYMGRSILPYEDTATLTLHVDGDSYTRGGSVRWTIDAPLTNVQTQNGLILVEA